MSWKTYASMNEQIHPDEALIQKTLERRRPRVNGKKLALRITAVAAILAILAASPVALAATSSTAYGIMYDLSPQMAQFFTPVNESCTDNGIRMEVLSARVTEQNTVEAYISIQDLAGGRIDESVDLFDSYSINTPFDSYGTCSQISYDDRTETAVFLISHAENSGCDLAGEKVTFSLRTLISHKDSAEDVAICSLPEQTNAESMELSTCNPPWAEYTLTGVPGTPENAPTSATVLVPSECDIALPQQFAHRVTGIGWIDGRLHIQVATDQKIERDAQAFLHLRDAGGEIIRPSDSYSFAWGMGKDDRTDYTEFIFDIPEDAASTYTLYADFSIAGLRTDGDWRVTFRLPESDQT